MSIIYENLDTKNVYKMIGNNAKTEVNISILLTKMSFSMLKGAVPQKP